MKLARVRISNILGIENLEFEAGEWIQIEGVNGEGKSSVIEAIKSVWEGAGDATLLRNGATQGEVVLVIDDGTVLKKKVTERGQSLTVTGGDGKPIGKPQSYVNGLADLLSINPVEFIFAKPEKRATVLLEAMPVTADVARLNEIIGSEQVSFNADAHGLAVVDAVFAEVYAHRRETNRAVTEKQSSITQLRQTLPEGLEASDVDPDDTEDSVQARIDRLDGEFEAETTRVARKLADLHKTHLGEVDAVRAQIAALQAEIANKVQAFAEIERKAARQREIARERHAAQRDPAQRTLDLLRANRQAHERARATRQIIARMEGELETLEGDAARQNGVLDALKTYKTELLESLPIPGLQVVDGKLYRDGVVFERLNQAQRIEIAVDVAKLRAGKLGIMCVDGIEAFDSEHLAAFREKAATSGLQLIVTRVADHALTVTSA